MTGTAATPSISSAVPGPIVGTVAAAYTSGLRRWQAEALPIAEDRDRRDVLIAATPGAGKTMFALTVAARALTTGRIRRVVVCAPTDHLRTQWADAAGRAGIRLDPTLPNTARGIRDGTHGYVTTYAQVAMNPVVHNRRVATSRTLVILDEIHHAADGQTWGGGAQAAFGHALCRLALSGTPFRSGAQRIPFITYEPGSDGAVVSKADYTYSYPQALADGVVRPVLFAAYGGQARWWNSAGTILSGQLGGGAKSAEVQAWQVALDPTGQWVPHVIAAIDERLSHLRAAGHSDAAGLILASDMSAARAYAKLVRTITGHSPTVALSDDPKSSRVIDAFNDSDDRFLIAVRQVSEGVDIRRLMALGWLTNYRTPLFFAQAVGRVLRARQPGESATVFLPAVRPLLELAATMEKQRDHVIAHPPPKMGWTATTTRLNRPTR